MDDQASAPAQAAVPTCYRHPKNETYVRCTRCDQYICPDCMLDAAVGHQCVECVRRDNKALRRPRTVFGGQVSSVTVVTYVLIGLNVLAYLAETAFPGVVDRFDSLGIGLRGPDGQYYVYQAGLPYGDGTGLQPAGVAFGEWERLITAAFLHLPLDMGPFSILHIGFNMYGLWTLGRVLESVLGKVRFTALYLLSALGGSVVAYLLAPGQGAVGASGAIFGLVAAYYVVSRRLRRPGGANRLLVIYLVWMVVSAGFASWQGHLGGLLAGGVVALCLAYLPRKWHLPANAAVLALLIALVVLKTSQLTGMV
ncbi:rhomboid family intramembrane serine protease [Planotetraspora kaengkrachanensis]|uniref:Rhomboid family intramembrane serine protease n=1 Tax=Planotetraspora kaengkrachanensis TaxID=575193 RepID=A0A8J3PW43_9ACTN|nr:rhomboid family intramembrane serine protease [Planotetraspora kaengkrachanensis]GIG82174.1 rhomboid family intramembrane serine protease [Planotetraspora kaengkrachanensis]